MKKIILTAAVAAFVSGCCGEGPATSKHSGNRYYPIKICSIGDMTGDSCIEYAAEDYTYPGRTIISFKTLDGHKYEFNTTGWAIIITKK